jgi:hypothetical protein
VSREFLCYVIGVPKGVEPKWTLGKERLLEAAKEYKDYDNDKETPDEKVAEDLEDEIANLKEAWESGNTDQAAVVDRGHEKLLITAGESCGDDPTEIFGTICRLANSGLLEEIGFDRPEAKDELWNELERVLTILERKGLKVEASTIRTLYHKLAARLLFS